MRVLQVHARYKASGGEDTVVDAEHRLLTEAGHDVLLSITPPLEGALPGVRAVATAAWNRSAAKRVVAMAEEFRPDIAHVHNTWVSLSPAVLDGLDAAGIPVVVTLHNYRFLCANARLFRDGRPCELCVDGSRLNGVLHRCYRDSALLSALVHGTSLVAKRRGVWTNVRKFFALTEEARALFLSAGLPEHSTVVKDNFVHDPGERPDPPSASSSVLFVGSLEPEKGIAVLLEAWQRAAPPDLRLIIVGTGSLEDDLRSSAPPSVRFMGHQAAGEVRRLMLEARALAFPSIWYEGQPMVVLEALAAGLPVAASSVPFYTSSMRHATELVVQGGSVGEWVRVLGRLSDDHAIDGWGVGSRALYERRHSPAVALAVLEREYGGTVGSS